MWRHRDNHRGTTFLVGNKNDPYESSFSSVGDLHPDDSM
jgi:hypothetical protein